jgi:hypothetical protein
MFAGHGQGSIQNVLVQSVGQLLCLFQREAAQKIKAQRGVVQYGHSFAEKLQGDGWASTLIFFGDETTRPALDSYIRHVKPLERGKTIDLLPKGLRLPFSVNYQYSTLDGKKLIRIERLAN